MLFKRALENSRLSTYRNNRVSKSFVKRYYKEVLKSAYNLLIFYNKLFLYHITIALRNQVEDMQYLMEQKDKLILKKSAWIYEYTHNNSKLF